VWALLFIAAAHAAEPPTDKVTVAATWASGGSLHRCTVRQLVAWRKGEVRFARVGGIGLDVGRVVEGHLHDPDFLKRPVGVALLDVIPLDGAAAAVDARPQGGVRGIWKLSRLPDGSYAVLSFEDTPLARAEAAAELEATARMTAGLASDDPQTQYNALRLFRDRCCPALVPRVIGMLGSDARVVVPDGMHWDGPEGGGVLPVDSTLGREAAAALRRTVAAFRGSDTPTEKDPAAAWKVWWDQVLKTEPFPRVVSDTVKCRELLALRLNQTWPEVFVSPDARHAVISAARLERPLDGMQSGICLLDLTGDTGARWIYRVPPTDINREPRPVQAAWGRNAVGIVFREFDSDEAKSRLVFLASDYKAAEAAETRELPLKGTANLALSRDDKGWLLAYMSGKGAVFAARLDEGGSLVGQPTQLAPDYADGRTHFHSSIESISIAPTDEGAAVAYDGDRGAFLALLDRQLTLRSTVRVDDPAPPRYSRSMPRVAWNGRQLLVPWIEEGGNIPDRLYLRLFDKDGRPLCEPILVADEAAALAQPVPLANGYVLAWVDHAVTPNRVSVGRVGNDGRLTQTLAVRHGLKPTYPIGLGVQGNVAHVLVYDRVSYPHRFLDLSAELAHR